MRAKTGQRGFSLVELMIVIAIMGILAAVVTPGIMATIPRYRLRAEARELLINFKKAKMEAVKRNRNVVISFTPGVGDLGGYQMCVDTDNDNDCIVECVNINTPNDNLPDCIVEQRMPKNVQLVAGVPAFNPAGYSFKGLPLGAANQNVKLKTSDGSREYTLTGSAAGNVRLQ